jgi:hypothetical protein
MFEPVASRILPAHLYLTSEWSATCKSQAASSCTNDPSQGQFTPGGATLPPGFLACLQQHGVDTSTGQINAPDPAVHVAGQACMAQLTPAEQQQLEETAGRRSGTYAWTDLPWVPEAPASHLRTGLSTRQLGPTSQSGAPFSFPAGGPAKRPWITCAEPDRGASGAASPASAARTARRTSAAAG